MSLIKINYHQYVGENINAPFSLDGVGFEPELLLNTISKNSVYWDCPAWKHKVSRTYLIKCPVDITLNVCPEKKELSSSNLNQNVFNQYCSPTFSTNWCTTEKTTIQLSIPRFLFWTSAKNIWVETKPHYNTVIKNNLTSIPAWFNLSSWTRPVSTSFDVIDTSKPIIIKRGDPLFEICFYSKNFNSGIILNKKEPSKELIEKMYQKSLIKQYVKNISQKFMFKEQKSKCPFEFMWK